MVASTASARYPVRLLLLGYSSISCTKRNRNSGPRVEGVPAGAGPASTVLSVAMRLPPGTCVVTDPCYETDRSATEGSAWACGRTGAEQAAGHRVRRGPARVRRPRE